jgi:formaldehyde-activating enzyme involved in methanogenesis
VVQAATGDAIVDCIAEGILPRISSTGCMIIMVWLDPRCATHAELDKKISVAQYGDKARDLAP